MLVHKLVNWLIFLRLTKYYSVSLNDLHYTAIQQQQQQQY